MDLREKIKTRMDQLQDWMESNYHLDHSEEVLEHISNITKFWSALSEEDQDYLHGARYAIDEQLSWNIPEESKRINKEQNNGK